ncbi:GNAT family N-acetyltransferase [Streptomyces sp. NPDC051976]|uniref:GNAT family N-acetyltransferase n=1 Tax=Streptomyces sp. NPDC051976 TaxID=3154947 RepID=UPI0034491915
MRYDIRLVEPGEWRKSKELRLAALLDPVSAVAFERSYAEESVLSDEAWQQRASGAGAQQFVAVSSTGSSRRSGRDSHAVRDSQDSQDDVEWVGMLAVVVERPDYLSINAVYLRPEARGTGLAEKLFAAAIAWVWDRADRVYLWVHQDNARAEAFYRRFGFTRTGEAVAYRRDPSLTEYEMVLTRT